MIKYELKSWSHLFDEIEAGRKLHDIRELGPERDFRVGDRLRLRRFDQMRGRYTGEELVVEVTYITSENTPCAFSSAVLQRGFCVLSIRRVEE